MRTIAAILKLFILLLLLSACRKSNFVPQPAPIVGTDSLLNWQDLGSVFQGLEDIWFVSPSKGFVIGFDIQQSTDSGHTWSPVPINYTSGNSGILYNLFFVNDQYGFAQGSTQLALTNDGGNSWTSKALTSSNGSTCFFINPSTGFYGDGKGAGLYKTRDTGNTWISVFNDTKLSEAYFPYFINADTGFVVTAAGLFANTVDGGQTWQQKSENLSSLTSGNSYSQIQFLDANTGFYPGYSGILKTTDGGTSWTNIFPVTNSSFNIIKFIDSQTGYYMTAGAIYKTSDGGETWALNCRVGTGDFIGMHFLDIHTGWACTSGGRIFRIQQ